MAPSRPGSGRTALVILSAPGAGAPVLARVLEAAGAAPPADAGAVAALNARVLASLGSGRDDPFGPRRRDDDPEPLESLAAEARALLRTAEAHAPLLVLADPAGARLAGFWSAALEAEGWRTACLVLVRRPGEAAAALTAAEGLTRHRGLLLWASYMLEAERAARGGRRVTVAYDRLLSDPEAELDRVERGLALRLPRRTWDSAAEIEAILRDAPRQGAAPPLPDALAPLDAFADHLMAAAADEPGNADVADETERWFATLRELAAPTARRPSPAAADPAPPAPAPDRAAEAALRDALAEAERRADTAEAQASILQSALLVARRRTAEAETLLQARATQASAGERDARTALAAALASREAAEAELARVKEGFNARTAEVEVLGDVLRSAEATLRAGAVELGDERERHADARERLAITGVLNHAAQTRVRELEARLADLHAEAERRRRWLPRLLGLR